MCRFLTKGHSALTVYLDTNWRTAVSRRRGGTKIPEMQGRESRGLQVHFTLWESFSASHRAGFKLLIYLHLPRFEEVRRGASESAADLRKKEPESRIQIASKFPFGLKAGSMENGE